MPDKKNNGSGGIIGIVILLVVFALLGYGGWYLYKENKKNSDSSIPSASASNTQSQQSPQGPPAPESVTINGETFNPSGYVVSKGWFWNRRDIPGYSPSPTTTNDECMNRCSQRSTCAQFARLQSSPGAGMCYLSESNNAEGDASHIRAIKKSGANSYSDSVYISFQKDTAGESPVSVQQCSDMCTRAASPSCIAWAYRQNNHTDPNYRRSCILYRNDTTQPQYAEGIIDRPLPLPQSPSPV